MARILVLGGNRFVGARLVNALSDAAHEIQVVNRGSKPSLRKANVTSIQLDRTHSDAFRKFILSEKPWDVVYDFCCYQPSEASVSAEIFQGRVRKYVLISSLSVYSEGSDGHESSFDPFAHGFHSDASGLDYAEGKRQTEAALFQKAEFPVLAVRFPIILGEDDYTQRLHFHVERVLSGRAIYFPNLEARISFINSEDACEFLAWALTKPLAGPLNVASSNPIVLSELMRWIESACRRKAVVVPYSSGPDAESPFGIEKDFTVTTERLVRAGYECRPLKRWLPELIDAIRVSETSRMAK